MSTSGASGPFRGDIGVARRDVTPPVGIRNRNWGPATSDVAAGVHRPFLLTALALRSADERVVVIAVDGTWWRRAADEARLRTAVIDTLDLRREQLLISLSHTHAGAVLNASDADLDGGALIPDYLERLRDAAIEAGRDALDAARPAVLDWGVGRCGVAANRDLDLDGRALVGFNADVPADDALLVGRVSDADGRPLATIVNYACHPTTLGWQNHDLSPDYVAQLRDTVESATGVPCLFLQGASGELAPREQYTGDTAVADKHGAAIGHAALGVLADLDPPGTRLELADVVESGAPLALWTPRPVPVSQQLHATVTDVELPCRVVASLDELAAQWAGIDPRSRDERLRRARALRENYLDPDRDTVTHPVWTIRIGDAALIAHPGEAYSSFQQVLRRHHDGPVAVTNLTNGPGFVYLPDADAYRRDAYQAWQTPLAPGALETLTDTAVASLAAVFEDGSP